MVKTNFHKRKQEERERKIAELARSNPYYAYEELKQFPDPNMQKNGTWERYIARELRI